MKSTMLNVAQMWYHCDHPPSSGLWCGVERTWTSCPL
jgi:hypothetical protein